jgi:putative membrane protein
MQGGAWDGHGTEVLSPSHVKAGKAQRERSGYRTALGALVGLVLLGLLLYHAGLEQVWQRVRLLGWSAPLIFVPYGIAALFETEAWRVTLPPHDRARVPFHGLYLTRMSGEAVNSVTPTATVGGEPVKAFILRRWGVPTSDGMASVVIARTALTAAQAIFTAIGIAAILEHLGRHNLALAWLSALLAGCVAFTAGLVWLQRRNPATALWRGLRRIAPTWQVVLRLEIHAAALDQRLADFYQIEKASFVRAALWSLCGWMFGVLEVYLFAALIDAPISWRTALIIEALGQPIRAVAIIIPGGIGAQELGGAALCTYLGMPEAAGVTLWLLKRTREIGFDAVGLLYLTRTTVHRALRGT